MGIPRMPFWYIHQNIVSAAGISIEYQVDVYSRRVFHNGYRFRTDGTDNKFKTKLLIKYPGTRKTHHPSADMIYTSNLFLGSILSNQGSFS